MLCAKATHKSGQTAQLINCKGVQRDRGGDWPTGESGAIHERILTHNPPHGLKKLLGLWARLPLEVAPVCPSSQKDQSSVLPPEL